MTRCRPPKSIITRYAQNSVNRRHRNARLDSAWLFDRQTYWPRYTARENYYYLAHVARAAAFTRAGATTRDALAITPQT